LPLPLKPLPLKRRPSPEPFFGCSVGIRSKITSSGRSRRAAEPAQAGTSTIHPLRFLGIADQDRPTRQIVQPDRLV
jgi:hypothetical protein